MIGDEQQFNVFCNTRLRGDELFRQKTDSFATCTTLCTSFQNPRCEGAQFKDDNGDCVLIGNMVPEGTRPSRMFDSAAALFPSPGPTSSCAQQGAGTTFLGQNASSFALRCGTVVDGKDLGQQFQMTFEGCLSACGADPACGGITFDPQQAAGFRNCYLKTTAVVDADVLAKSGVDSAVLVSNNGASPAGGDQEESANTSSSSTAVALSTPVAASSGGTVFVTVMPGPEMVSGSVVTVSVPIPATSTPSSSALADSTAEASSAVDTGLGDTDTNNTNSDSGRPRFGNGGPSTSSNAWIAAPVIGGIAALTLILAVFVLWGRRRRRDNVPPPSDSGKAMPMSRAALSNLGRGLGDAASRMSHGRIFFGSGSGGGGGGEKTRLGDSDTDSDDPRLGNSRGGFKVVSGSGRRLGLNGQEIPGTGPGLGGMIISTGGGKIVEDPRRKSSSSGSGSGSGGVVRSGSPAGSAAGLRDSQNGLRQNRLTGNWLDSQPGIPAEFRGPEFK
ncbi:hypothetical protein SAMD00023353_0301130 [Rosellinia necatrix]|uniref:Apple domain-containing protein n=1 Tax=Rosellinia necatrix TaxID=77044 RepID=A0A1W2TDC5_ROSNE|nr:hypothetical protein SAMD00023353_0301130 [Rosellinia necatrix]